MRRGGGDGIAAALPQLDIPSRARAADPQLALWLCAARRGAVSNLNELVTSELITAQDPFGSALHHAVASDSVDAVKWLLSNGAPLDLKGMGGHTALHVATHAGNNCVVPLVSAKACIHARSKSGLTPLHHAVVGQNVHAIEALLDAGALVSVRGSGRMEGITAISVAHRIAATASGTSRQRDSSMVVKLLDAASVREKRWFRAARHCDTAVLCTLLQQGQPVDTVVVTDGPGITALMIAARLQRPDVVQLLLSHSADVRAEDKNGCTALHHFSRAAMSITPADEVARRLLAAGARTTARNVAGCDCVEYARVHSDEKRHDNAAPIVAMLEKARALERRMHL